VRSLCDRLSARLLAARFRWPTRFRFPPPFPSKSATTPGIASLAFRTSFRAVAYAGTHKELHGPVPVHFRQRRRCILPWGCLASVATLAARRA